MAEWRQIEIVAGKPQGNLTPAIEINEKDNKRTYTLGVLINQTFRMNMHHQQRFARDYIELWSEIMGRVGP